jgi:hypothetical protein
MSSEWCDTDPHVQIMAERGDPVPVQVVVSCPTREQATAAHRDGEFDWRMAADGSSVTILASNIRSPYRLRANSKKFNAQATAPPDGGAFQPGEVGSVTLDLR